MSLTKAPRPGRVLAFTLLMIGGIVMVTPLVFMLLTSLKTNSEVYELNFWPNALNFDNYLEILTRSKFRKWFLVSFSVAIVSTVSVLFFDSLIGYTLAKFQFRGRSIVFVAILSTLMIPTEMLVIPWYVLAKSMGWLNTIWGVMFPGVMSGFGVFLMRQFFMGIPDELIDAARIDGHGEFQIFWQIALPLVTPALSALAIFAFLGNWTAFLWPLISTTNPDLYTVPVGLASLSGEFQTDWEMIMTGSSIATIPTLLVFILLQRNIINGITLAGLKG
jgi:multiple sugar transport system permease protein